MFLFKGWWQWYLCWYESMAAKQLLAWLNGHFWLLPTHRMFQRVLDGNFTKRKCQIREIRIFCQKTRQIDGTLFCDFDRFFVEFQFKTCWDTMYVSPLCPIYLWQRKRINANHYIFSFFFSFSIPFRLLKNILSRVYFNLWYSFPSGESNFLNITSQLLVIFVTLPPNNYYPDDHHPSKERYIII